MMKKTNTAKVISVPTEVEHVLSDSELSLFKDVTNKWWDRFCGSKKYAQGSFDNMIGNINRLTLFLGKPFWEWETSDLDRWFGHLGRINALATSTQRIVQSNIYSFFEFVSELSLAREIEQKTGFRLRQICTKDIRIPHRVEREGKNARRNFTDEHLDKFFNTIDEGIEEAQRFNSKDLRSRMRDKAILFAVYSLGLRRQECCDLTIRSFEPRNDRPELGDYAFFHIYGKGSKYRSVANLDPLLASVMDWYVTEVRPQYLSIKTANIYALFLSERGLPISDDQLESGFNRILVEANLADFGYTLHCLRHTYVTHATPIIGLDAVQGQVGHVFRSTTESYYHTDPKSISNQINVGINKTINLRGNTK